MSTINHSLATHFMERNLRKPVLVQLQYDEENETGLDMCWDKETNRLQSRCWNGHRMEKGDQGEWEKDLEKEMEATGFKYN